MLCRAHNESSQNDVNLPKPKKPSIFDKQTSESIETELEDPDPSPVYGLFEQKLGNFSVGIIFNISSSRRFRFYRKKDWNRISAVSKKDLVSEPGINWNQIKLMQVCANSEDQRYAVVRKLS
jgi:hypothetical protein